MLAFWCILKTLWLELQIYADVDVGVRVQRAVPRDNLKLPGLVQGSDHVLAADVSR